MAELASNSEQKNQLQPQGTCAAPGTKLVEVPHRLGSGSPSLLAREEEAIAELIEQTGVLLERYDIAETCACDVVNRPLQDRTTNKAYLSRRDLSTASTGDQVSSCSSSDTNCDLFRCVEPSNLLPGPILHNFRTYPNIITRQRLLSSDPSHQCCDNCVNLLLCISRVQRKSYPLLALWHHRC